VEQIAEAISHAVSRQNQLVLDPFAAALVIGIVVTYLALRATGKRKSTRQRIAEMEDADFPVDEVDPGVQRPEPPAARSPSASTAPSASSDTDDRATRP